jgi:hypothetical protein
VSNPFDETNSRTEVVKEFRLGSGARIKRLTLRSDITIDDVHFNNIKAEAARVKTGKGRAPVIRERVKDYLMRANKWP